MANFVVAETEAKQNKGLNYTEPLAPSLLKSPSTSLGFSRGQALKPGEETRNVDEDP
jgi:hypothetical protein